MFYKKYSYNGTQRVHTQSWHAIFYLNKHLSYKYCLQDKLHGGLHTFNSAVRPSFETLVRLTSRKFMVYFGTFAFPGVTEELDLPAESLHSIFQSLIQALLKTSGSYQRVRANLYGSLLYYLQIGRRKDEKSESLGKFRDYYWWWWSEAPQQTFLSKTE